jgi:hypothetical protein
MTPKLKWLLAVAATALFTLVAFAGPAAAQVSGGDEVAAPVWVIPAPTVTLIVAVLVPVLNGLALRPSNPAWVKALVANGIATVAYAITQAVANDGAALLTEAWFHGLLASLVTMTAVYFGVWKPVVNPDQTVPTVVPLGDWLTPKRLRSAA